MTYYLGVDGGGTKTEFLLVEEKGRILGRKVVGGSNPNDIGIDNAYKLLLEGVKSLCEAHGVPLKDTYVYVGGSGCGVGSISQTLRERMQKEVKGCAFSSDLPTVVEMGLAEENGIVVIAGTGSVFAVKKAGVLTVVGGNGYLFEEYGSGFALARAGFTAALAQVDGLGEETLLLPLFEEKLGGKIKSRLNEIYRGGKRYIAEFAPLVLRAFAQGDGAARKIVEENARYISTTVNGLAGALDGEVKVALAGGTFQNEQFLGKVLEGFDEGITPFRLQAPPVFGAVRLARKLQDADVYGIFTDNLLKEISMYKKLSKEGVI